MVQTTINPPAITKYYDGSGGHQQDFNSHIEGRVGRLEGAVESLTHEVQETSRAVREMSNGIGLFKEDVLRHIGTATAPKWPLIVSFIMIALTIITLGSTLVAKGISGQDTAISKLSERIEVKDAQEIKNAFMDGEHKAWRDYIDSTVLSKTTDTQNQIIALRDWRLTHESASAIMHGEIDTKINTLEKIGERLELRQYDIARLVSQLDYLRPGGGVPIQKPKTGIDK